MKVIGLDITTGTRSNFGVAVVDFSENADQPKLIKAFDFATPKDKELRPRLKYIAAKLATEFKALEELNEPYIIVIENTILPGKANQQLQRIVGAILTVSPRNRLVFEVYPMQVKLHITGEGKGSDKKKLANCLKKWFNGNELLFQLTASSRFDATDAIGIAITGYKLYQGISNVKRSKILPNVKSCKTKQKSPAKP